MVRQINSNITFTASRSTIEKYDDSIRHIAEKNRKEKEAKEKASNSKK